MARECYFCGKKYKIVNRRIKLRGKYNPTTKRRQKANLQLFKLSPTKRVLACTKCIKKKTKKLKKERGVG